LARNPVIARIGCDFRGDGHAADRVIQSRPDEPVLAAFGLAFVVFSRERLFVRGDARHDFLFLCMVMHDTIFYWSHRFMHWRPVFPYFHRGHHRFVTPMPWAIYAFQPLEAVTQSLGILLIVLFLPLHPLALLLFLG